MTTATRIATLAAGALLAGGCGMLGYESGAGANAELKPTAGNAVSGTVRFQQRGGKVLVTANVAGLKPGAEHGFHVHDKGDCSAADGMSAGGHFNPASKPHGSPQHAERHAGDMPNLKADAGGKAVLSFETDLLAVGAGASNVVGRSVIVHRDPDDFTTQPTGNSGPRLACGLVVAAK